LKILFVLPEYGSTVRGGIATFYRHLVSALVCAGTQVDICVAEPIQGDRPPVQVGVKLLSIEAADVDRATSHLQHLAIFPELRATLARAFAAWEVCGHGSNYDVVEATDWGLLYVPWVIQHSGPPVVVQFHGSNGQVSFHDPFEGNELEDLVTRTLEMALLGRADELQSGGRINAEEWSHLLCRSVHHIWPACTAEEVSTALLPAGLEPGSFGLVVGRIQGWKGPKVLCQASALLADRAPRIIWVGRDHPFRRLDRSLSDELRKNFPDAWGRSITPVRELPFAEVAAVQAAAKFVVVPSTWDTFNLTAAEAMVRGKVVICSDGAGAADLIENGVNGFRFPANDATKLASLLINVDEMSAADRDAIGNRAKETISRELSTDRICALRLERYAQVGATGRSAHGAHPWLDSFFAASVPGAPLAFLDKLPLKQLIRYVGRRAGHRLLPGIR
jgi:glycosyltransferase involved in cell wall biosynthesis